MLAATAMAERDPGLELHSRESLKESSHSSVPGPRTTHRYGKAFQGQRSCHLESEAQL